MKGKFQKGHFAVGTTAGQEFEAFVVFYCRVFIRYWIGLFTRAMEIFTLSGRVLSLEWKCRSDFKWRDGLDMLKASRAVFNETLKDGFFHPTSQNVGLVRGKFSKNSLDNWCARDISVIKRRFRNIKHNYSSRTVLLANEINERNRIRNRLVYITKRNTFG